MRISEHAVPAFPIRQRRGAGGGEQALGHSGKLHQELHVGCAAALEGAAEVGFEGDGGAAVGREGAELVDAGEEFGCALAVGPEGPELPGLQQKIGVAVGLEFRDGRYVPKNEGLVEVCAER